MRWRLAAALGLGAVALAVAGGPDALAQRGWRGGWYRMPPKFPAAAPTHRAFTFSRVLYESDRREPGGQGWHTDYPSADQNLMIRLSEMTTTHVGFDRHDEPDHVVVRLTDNELFNYPFIFMSDVGTVYLSPLEVDRLREYLLKGGFLWVDDFWGPHAWEQWISEISEVLPPGSYPIFDIADDHPILRVQYDVDEIPQIPSIQHWRRSGGATTSERGIRSDEVHFRGIADTDGRLMVLMSHNTDIADGWEREGEDYEFFYRFSVKAYAVGINTVVHAMTN